MSDAKTLAQLSEESGLPARTIRFYIARGLLDGPVKAGRGAVYTQHHLARIGKIKELQAQGRMLSEIVNELGGDPPAGTTAAASPWWQHPIQPDVIVWVRADVTPWRMKQIRAAIEKMETLLQQTNPSTRTKHS